MTVWRLLGRVAAIMVGAALLLVAVAWPVLVWGWGPWTALYVGFVAGRLMLFEIHNPLRRITPEESHRVVPEDVR